MNAPELARARGRSVAFAASALFAMLLVFGGVVAWVSLDLRAEIREQLTSRDAALLRMVAQNEIRQLEDRLPPFGLVSLEPEELWIGLLDTAEAEGVFAVQLFDSVGASRFVSTALALERLQGDVIAAAGRGESVSRFHPDALLSQLARIEGEQGDARVAALDVFIPLISTLDGSSLGVARFLLEGESLAREFALLDGRIARQASVAAGAGGLLIVGIFGFAWRRLSVTNRHLLERSGRLRRANAELALLARSSALGSVTAHLIHGLKNPLAGLRQLVAAQGLEGGRALDAEEIAGANEAAARMESMIQEVVEILQGDAAGASYDVSGGELRDELRKRFAPVAAGCGVNFRCEGAVARSIDSHRANIALMVLSNLVQNAIDALAVGQDVAVSILEETEALVARVADNGPGIAEDRREALFLPQVSRKQGGAGIGLALSMQLARHIGADLRLAGSSTEGSVFEIRIPWKESSE